MGAAPSSQVARLCPLRLRHISHIPHSHPGQEVSATILVRPRDSDLHLVTRSIGGRNGFCAQVWLAPELALPTAWCGLFSRSGQRVQGKEPGCKLEGQGLGQEHGQPRAGSSGCVSREAGFCWYSEEPVSQFPVFILCPSSCICLPLPSPLP